MENTLKRFSFGNDWLPQIATSMFSCAPKMLLHLFFFYQVWDICISKDKHAGIIDVWYVQVANDRMGFVPYF